MDKIIIRQSPVPAHIGCTTDERSLTQTLRIDLEIQLSIAEAAQTGDLSKTICWVDLQDKIRIFTAERQWVLVEEYIDSLAGFLLETFSRIQALTLVVWKYPSEGAEAVAVQVFRERH